MIKKHFLLTKKELIYDKLKCKFNYCSILDIKDKEKYDIIWLEQTFHLLEPRYEIISQLSSLLKSSVQSTCFSNIDSTNICDI